MISLSLPFYGLFRGALFSFQVFGISQIHLFLIYSLTLYHKRKWGLPGGSVVKNLPTNAGDMGSVPRSGGSPGEGNGNPL